MASYLTAIADLLGGIGRELADDRWTGIADAVEAAAGKLRELTR